MIFFCNLNYPHSDFFGILLCSFIAVLSFDAKTQKLHSLETTNLIFGKIRARNILFEAGQEESLFFNQHIHLFLHMRLCPVLLQVFRCLCVYDMLKSIPHLLLKYFFSLFSLVPASSLSQRLGTKRNSKIPFDPPPSTPNF